MTAYEMRISDWSSDVCSSDLYFAMPLTRMKSYRPKAQAPRFGQPARWRGRAMQQSREHIFIGNQWVAPSSGRRFTLPNASTEEAIVTVDEEIEAAIDAAVTADRNALDCGDWSDLAPANPDIILDRFMPDLPTPAS